MSVLKIICISGTARECAILSDEKRSVDICNEPTEAEWRKRR